MKRSGKIILALALMGCGPKPAPARPTAAADTPGRCNCVCMTMNNVNSSTWDNRFFSAKDTVACSTDCIDYSTRFTTCTGYFDDTDVHHFFDSSEPTDKRTNISERYYAAAPKDADNDGLSDQGDKCPNEPGPPENDGCPEKDSDGDGVVDRLDKCPSEAGPAKTNGCPDKDSDGDGVPDRLDRCPAAAAPGTFDGCPLVDTDGDGIIDALDKCPSEPETKNGYQDKDGCPDEVPAALAAFSGTIEGIVFKSGSAVIDPKSFPILEGAAKVLGQFAETHVEISGHTDNVGKADVNTALSARRAEAVKLWLEQHGVAAGRLEAKGFGPTKPIGDNGTEAGRQKNRRVEFKLVGTSTSSPTPAAK